MPKCLGIYIEENIIKYSKVDKNKDVLKIDASNTVFYENGKAYEAIEKIIGETFSTRDPICINISNELYNYFEVFSALKPADQKKSVDLDFELLCGEKGYNKDSLDSRFIMQESKESNDKLRALHIATNKENLRRRLQDFSGYKVVSATPITTSISNLVNLPPKEDNVIIVNLERDTKITTILNGEVYNVLVIPEGMEEILSNINATENSLQKSYECLKNTTIYTQDSQDLQAVDDNEHLEDVMPTLYKIVTEVRKIVDSTVTQISRVYITGSGTAINNVDLYFQEYIANAKCELLKPFFMENASIKIPVKEYIEVNSATALALEGLGYGIKDLNFKAKAGMDMNIDAKSLQRMLKSALDWRKPLTAIDKTMLRVLACVLVGVVGYCCFSNYIVEQIDTKTTEAQDAKDVALTQVNAITSDMYQVMAGTTQYSSLIDALTATDESDDDDSSSTSTDTTTTIIEKDSIPNLLNRIVYVIPEQVQITSIKNTSGTTHIVIQAQAAKYEQLGYFKAALTNDGILENVKSSSGSKSGDTVTITIEGDLP